MFKKYRIKKLNKKINKLVFKCGLLSHIMDNTALEETSCIIKKINKLELKLNKLQQN